MSPVFSPLFLSSCNLLHMISLVISSALLRMFDVGDIALLKTYGIGPYTNQIKQIEEDISKLQDTVKELIGIKER